MKKGFSDAMFVPKWSTKKFLELSGKAGFDGVELNFRENGGDLTDDTTLADAREIADMAKSYGLEIPSITTSHHNVYAISAGDQKLRQRGIDIARKMMEFAAAMDCPVIQVVPGVPYVDTPYQKGYELAQEALRELGDEAKSLGVTIGLENVCNNFLHSPLEFSRFLNEINHPNVKFYLDNGNALKTGFPEHYMELMGDQLCCVHFKDYRIKSNDNVALLDGDIDWISQMEWLKKVNYDGYVINTPATPFTYCQERLVEQSAQDLKAVLGLLEKVENPS
ncbi:sugar phosphate isomerase/epimerase family protein [Aciduricibacillus chroicocephali]|uniref:Sugar phosphate isomerase/epimerase family protein n=1 Tax=Aciduricibacillus chroicocephali TaxID=3054939 RepID=A0ABY9KW55_9BACI|nr:sugar phosphate isomerase/epimerase family protein [Bacillaceae bacterium 44XB]